MINVDEEKLSIIKKEAIEKFVPIISDESLGFIEVMLNIIKPKNVLEIGTAVGYSASNFCKCLDDDSKIVTIERNDRRFKEASKNIKELGLEKNVEILFGDALDVLPTLKDNTFDVIFIDAAKGQYIKFLEEAKRLAKNGSVIIADNVLFHGLTLSDYNEHRNRTAVTRLRQFIDIINTDKMLKSTLIKIGDGLTVSYITKPLRLTMEIIIRGVY